MAALLSLADEQVRDTVDALAMRGVRSSGEAIANRGDCGAIAVWGLGMCDARASPHLHWARVSRSKLPVSATVKRQACRCALAGR